MQGHDGVRRQPIDRSTADSLLLRSVSNRHHPMEPKPIAVLKLSTRTSNTLKRNGIFTVAQLQARVQILPYLIGMGVGGINEIMQALRNHNDN